jgi:hypothetical protein
MGMKAMEGLTQMMVQFFSKDQFANTSNTP